MQNKGSTYHGGHLCNLPLYHTPLRNRAILLYRLYERFSSLVVVTFIPRLVVDQPYERFPSLVVITVCLCTSWMDKVTSDKYYPGATPCRYAYGRGKQLAANPPSERELKFDNKDINENRDTQAKRTRFATDVLTKHI